MEHNDVDGFTIEGGLSVSVESSPRTPVEEWRNVLADCCAPFKKGTFIEEEESISPRVLFPEERQTSGRGSGWHCVRNVGARRRLDFSMEELSPIAASPSLSPPPSWDEAMKDIDTARACAKDTGTVGECSVCYADLPSRSNHVFTICGHLFCVKCLLTWWDTSITCPMCRSNLLATDTSVVCAEEEEEEEPPRSDE
jgi:hypothetical protein